MGYEKITAVVTGLCTKVLQKINKIVDSMRLDFYLSPKLRM